ncbi:YbcC family protein [Paragemmobacter straminiformis]|uniref:Probable inorganic carbon transporter subunit DabA n=1 Tax=Paragemmobacter straminiformis TaxID=2045119 RepID=A0A842I7P9_9RHOB|nr:DUF2309 domain-containing protein [Gemmobacter straminiformis]MBC2835656.1 DUF2309 domain-containing protein [Gemmobacter straminiformis]
MLVKHRDNFTGPFLEIISAARAAMQAIPPAFPLSATVAVNPFLGQSALGLAETSARLGRVGGLRLTLPRSHFAAEVAAGRITHADLAAAASEADLTLPELLAALDAPEAPLQPIPTVADLAAQLSGIDWPTILLDRIGSFCAARFDQGQALWPLPAGEGLYAAWRAHATHDLVPEIAGLTGFADHAAAAPDDAWSAVARAVSSLGIGAPEAELYFHALLHRLGGWAQAARWQLWQAELQGGTDGSLADLLALRLIWDEALLARYGAPLAELWAAARVAFGAAAAPGYDDALDAALQSAAERAAQRRLADALQGETPQSTAPKLQAAFCIDVRSEVFRRALESLDPAIETIGFAGFFGLPLAHRPFGAVAAEAHLPVLLAPALNSAPAAAPQVEEAARIAARSTRAWGRFRQAAVSSFAFVEAVGPLYGAKLLRDALGFGGKSAAPEPAPVIEGLDRNAKVAIGAKVLGAMSLRAGFAPLVLLVGHGAHVVNNAHRSALQCGACGGHSGAVSARALAALLNDPETRAGLAGQGIDLPATTRFVAALHDTVSDEVTLFDAPEGMADVGHWLQQAAQIARAERAGRLPRAGHRGRALQARARDWAETRPEWGLSGCASFIAAPRFRTKGRDLGGRAFLHSYDWRQDEGFATLELILTAPVVVASWISLQYYGSTVAPQAFGGGNKLLHNVVGGFGVLEGHGGAPRVGLPWQSVHDGERLQHDPLRLTVLVEAPAQAITDILARHAGVRDLFDQKWLHLLRIDDAGQVADRYLQGMGWEPFASPARKAA